MPLALHHRRNYSLHLGELLDGVDAAHPQMIGAHVQHYPDIDLVKAESGAKKSATRSLQDCDVNSRIREDDVCRERTGHVALEHHPVLEIRAIGRGEADDILAESEQVSDQPDGGGLSVRARHGDHWNRGLRSRRVEHIDDGGPDIPWRSLSWVSVHPDARTGVHLDDHSVVLAKRD